MKAILIIYILLQILAYLFLKSEFEEEHRINTHVCLTIIAMITYFSVSFRNPGFLISDAQELNEQMEVNDQKKQQQSSSKLSEEKSDFCNKCRIFRRKRSKHCNVCSRCVATFDHHCIWLGNCIGQKNRPLFQLCLLFNSVQITHAIIALIAQMIDKREWHRYQIAFLSVLGLLIIGIVILLGLHIILMLKNLTTWQIIRWEKINYLSGFNQSDDSPFSKGAIKNIVQYWSISFSRSFHDWSFIDDKNQINFRKAQLPRIQVQKSYDFD